MSSPTFNDRNPFNGYINPYYCVYDHSLLYMEMMGVDGIDHTYHLDLQVFDACKDFQHIIPNGGLMVKVKNHLLTTCELYVQNYFLGKMPSPNVGGPLSVLQLLTMDSGASVWGGPLWVMKVP